MNKPDKETKRQEPGGLKTARRNSEGAARGPVRRDSGDTGAKPKDPIRLEHIGLAAAAVAALLILLAGGTVASGLNEAKEAAETGTQTVTEMTAGAESGAEGTESGEEAAAGAEGSDAQSGAEGGDGTSGTESGAGTEEVQRSLIERTAIAARQKAEAQLEEMNTVSITVSAVGDCTLGMDDDLDYDMSFNASYEENGAGWFLEKVRDTLQGDNLTIANFEGVLTSGGERADKEFCFRGEPEYTQVLTEGGIEALNLANNHAFDYGSDSYFEMKDIMAEAGIDVFGYDNSIVIDVNGVKVGLTGTYELDEGIDVKEKMLAEIEKVKGEGAQLVISSFHWGDEGETEPNSIQKELAHAAVDAGADLVLGHHPHVLQAAEIYNGKYIFYSLGNFCYGGSTDPYDYDTAIVQQTFTFNSKGLADASQAEVIPCSVTSAEDYNNYQPTPYPADSSGYLRVLEKLAMS